MSRARTKRYLLRWRQYEARCEEIDGYVNPIGARLTAASAFYGYRLRRIRRKRPQQTT